MVEIPLTDLGGPCVIEVDGGDIRWVVRNKEVTVQRWHQANQQCRF
ncbi:Uncharacterised protein [Vibrio cholerae]|uniref:Uncharacterized protein n=1 Tax=Vibrio cholerae TaxID=666 RepID=A0A655RLW2_VIBCL|nr:Uncharacterised protein [Vibrio cholerae]CSD09769.1 Uncharacterised protein [Vibrio cholerae]